MGAAARASRSRHITVFGDDDLFAKSHAQALVRNKPHARRTLAVSYHASPPRLKGFVLAKKFTNFKNTPPF